jgi:hypothetical protein
VAGGFHFRLAVARPILLALGGRVGAPQSSALSLHELEQDFAGDAYRHGDLVFANALGGAILPRTASDRFLRLRKAAGIPLARCTSCATPTRRSF